MLLEATDADVIEMGRLAVLASVPMGMGHFHHQPDLKKSDIAIALRSGGVNIDYYAGRMVKFWALKVEGGYEVADRISPDYESWISTYPSYVALFEAAKSADAIARVADDQHEPTTRA